MAVSKLNREGGPKRPPSIALSKLCSMLGLLCMVFAFADTATATMIVVIATKDGYWLAADSYRSGGGKHIKNVCKIHETRLGLVAKSGGNQGTKISGEVYSTDKEVENLIASSKDLSSFQSNLKVRYEYDIDEELALLVDKPFVTPEDIEGIPMRQPIPVSIARNRIRTIVMFDTNGADSAGKVLLVQPKSDERIDSGRKYYKYWAQAEFAWHPIDTFPFPITGFSINCPVFVHEIAHIVPCEKPGIWIQKHPKDALRRMLERGHLMYPESVGPPYAIVHIIKGKSKVPKVKWISKGVCPGWSDKADPKYSLIGLRDELRKQQSAIDRTYLGR